MSRPGAGGRRSRRSGTGASDDRAEPHQPAGATGRRGRRGLCADRPSGAVQVVRVATSFVALAVMLVLSIAAGILVGSVPIAPGDVLGALLGSADVNGTIVRDLRLPRVLGSVLVGGSLATSGALLQGLLRNPLADPFVTGTSAGATLAAIVAIALGLSAPLVPLAAFVGALVAVGLA